MYNELMFLATIVLYFAMLLVSYKLFGKFGLYLWIAIATIGGNIEALKMVHMFGMPATLGNVLYGSTFLATDILSEKFGKKDAQKSVAIGFFAMIAFMVITQMMLTFTPSADDFAHQSMATIFSVVPRLAVASMVTYFIMQYLDIFLYHYIWAKTGDKMLWLRNNGATLITQLFDSTIFTLLAFTGVYEFNVVLSLIIPTYLIKVVVSLMDTPFIYLARKIKPLA